METAQTMYCLRSPLHKIVPGSDQEYEGGRFSLSGAVSSHRHTPDENVAVIQYALKSYKTLQTLHNRKKFELVSLED